MQNHGLLACGRTARETFNLHYHLDMACKIQVDVLASGEEVVQLPRASVDALSDIYSRWRERLNRWVTRAAGPPCYVCSMRVSLTIIPDHGTF